MRTRGAFSLGARHRVALAAIALVSASALSACGGAPGAPRPPATSAAVPLTPHSLARLKALASPVAIAATKTFQATWASTGKGATTVVLAQSPPRQTLVLGHVEVVRNGAHSWFCSAGHCVDEHGLNPLVGVLRLYGGAVLAADVKAIRLPPATVADAVRIGFGRDTIGGLPSTCAAMTQRARTSTWCVSQHTGIVTFWSARGGGFRLTGYSATPQAALLRRP